MWKKANRLIKWFSNILAGTLRLFAQTKKLEASDKPTDYRISVPLTTIHSTAYSGRVMLECKKQIREIVRKDALEMKAGKTRFSFQAT